MQMNSFKQIEQAVTSLPEDKFRKLCDRMIELDHQKWDRQIMEDSQRTMLDGLANRAFAEYNWAHHAFLNHHKFSDFCSCLKTLSPVIQEQADKSFEVLKANLRHPALLFKRLGK